MITKPDRIFDRQAEWDNLARFAERAGSRAQLAVVSGRRRQGKTFLLEALARETGGLYFGATQATEAESLRLFAAALGRHLRVPVGLRFAGWDEAIIYLFSLDPAQVGLVVIDEFPYLTAASVALPSIIQREIDAAVSRDAGISLILCGSAMSVMGGLLAGSAPLRGRAAIELVVRPFDYATAARFWGVADPRLSVLLHAVVGGTPAYRRPAEDGPPESLDDFDGWVQRTVLNPANPLFREARYLLEEEVEVRETALYHSVLAAVANGNSSRGGIANYIGRRAADIGHYLNVLEDSGLLHRSPDVFRSARSTYDVAEPLISFYQVVMRPQWGFLESGRSAEVWAQAKASFLDQVVGPHFERICREYAATVSMDLFGGLPGEVGSGVVADPARRDQIQIDVAVLAPAQPGQPRRVLSLGEAKWGKTMGLRHLARLARARELLAGRGYDTTDTVLACYAGVGFEPHMPHAYESARVLRLGPSDLYSQANPESI